MGKKKNKKSFYKKQLRPFVRGNQVLLAALSGAAAGIAIATILGTERAKELLHTVEDSVQGFTNKLSSDYNGKKSTNEVKASRQPA